MKTNNPKQGGMKSHVMTPEVSVLIALLALCAVMTFMSPYFLTFKNIFNVLRQFSLICVKNSQCQCKCNSRCGRPL